MDEVRTENGAEGFRVQVQPDLAVLVDESGCIVLEAGLGDPKRRVTVTNADQIHAALKAAREHVIIGDNRWYRQRLADMAEAGRRARGEA